TASRPRAWRTAPWPTSTSPFVSCSTTEAPPLCPHLALQPAKSLPWPSSTEPCHPLQRELIRPPRTQTASIDGAASPPAAMVGVVQLVERQVVILNVAGSSPVTHPTGQRAFRPLTFFLPRALSAPGCHRANGHASFKPKKIGEILATSREPMSKSAVSNAIKLAKIAAPRWRRSPTGLLGVSQSPLFARVPWADLGTGECKSPGPHPDRRQARSASPEASPVSPQLHTGSLLGTSAG
ncbi:MAG: hypothetical protein QOD34_2286, partial [Mycobacterium sp.]|nr:hypothetical protein [Mycobacterium sp.]